MRIVAYLALTVGFILAIATLTMSHSLASDGRTIGSLFRQREWKEQQIDDVSHRMLSEQSIESVVEHAYILGFEKPVGRVEVAATNP